MLYNEGSLGLRGGRIRSLGKVKAQEAEFPLPLITQWSGCIGAPYSSWEWYFPNERGKGYEYSSYLPFVTTGFYVVDSRI